MTFDSVLQSNNNDYLHYIASASMCQYGPIVLAPAQYTLGTVGPSNRLLPVTELNVTPDWNVATHLAQY